MRFKKGELKTTLDINRYLLMGELKGDEVWALEDLSKTKTNEVGK